MACAAPRRRVPAPAAVRRSCPPPRRPPRVGAESGTRGAGGPTRGPLPSPPAPPPVDARGARAARTVAAKLGLVQAVEACTAVVTAARIALTAGHLPGQTCSGQTTSPLCRDPAHGLVGRAARTRAGGALRAGGAVAPPTASGERDASGGAAHRSLSLLGRPPVCRLRRADHSGRADDLIGHGGGNDGQRGSFLRHSSRTRPQKSGGAGRTVPSRRRTL